MPQYTHGDQDVPLIPQATYNNIHLCNLPVTTSLLKVGFEQEFFLPNHKGTHALFRTNYPLHHLYTTAFSHNVQLYGWHAEKHDKQFEFATHPKPAQQACLELILLRYLLEQLDTVDWYDSRSALQLHITHPHVSLKRYASHFGSVSEAKNSEVRLLSNRIEIRYPRADANPWSVIADLDRIIENIFNNRDEL